MTYFSGRDGSLVYNNQVIAKVSEWAITANVAALTTTVLGQRNENFVPGNLDADGSAVVLYYLDAPVNLINKVFRVNTDTTDPAILSMRLRYGGNTINFNCIITSAELTCTVGEVMQATVSFKVTNGFTGLTLNAAS